jgi:hypothetical protein
MVSYLITDLIFTVGLIDTLCVKMKNTKYNTFRTILKSNHRVVKRGIIDTAKTHIHDRSLSWHGTGISMTIGGGYTSFMTQTSDFSKNNAVMQVFPYVNKMTKYTREVTTKNVHEPNSIN